ncbi:Uso1 / p115 like vesicle tethering protein, head region [Ancylostoma caninum]|uniref:Uso1 / p115 like vesicle tethering protein, head region n=1 Tax=Ancylostoma caninum TaxID=29170 RepID=A0A368FY46_ANCCA|nr:Uso1 / p115 like vesicle tethering protein, head region [Ancylostoma caninum]
MAYFRSFFGGGGVESEEEDGAEIVEKMVERAETCTALEDRRDALRALRSMAKKLRLAVGTMGLNVYMEVLEKERFWKALENRRQCISGQYIATISGIIIEDCLFVILNLLRKNAMNQQLFRENNLISRLGVVLNTFLYGNEEDEPDSGEWVKQRTANIIFLLQVIRSLVSPDNSVTNTHAAQKALHQTKMLAELCRVLLSEMGLPVEVLTETVIAVAEAIRGNYTNQEYFASTSLITNENVNRSSLVVLLISMTAEKQPFKMRCAVFYCFLSYLHDNEFGKTKVIETLLPASQPETTLSTGSLICQAITSGESVQCWFGCVSLLYCLLDVEHLSEQLLRVQLSTTIDHPPISLLKHISNLLVSMGNRRVQMRAGVLMLLSTWLNNCPAAVAGFIENEDNLHYLTTQILDDCGEGTESEQQVLKGLMAFLLLVCLQNVEDANARTSLEQLVDRRVGREVVIGAVEGLSRTEQFVRAAQKPQPLTKTPNELFLDYHFIKMFKASEGQLLKMLRPTGEFNGTASNDSIIQSFKDLIKRQDEEIAILKQEAKRSAAQIEQLKQAYVASRRNYGNKWLLQSDKTELQRELEEVKKKLEESRAVSAQNESIQLQMQEMYRVNEQWRAEAGKYKQWAEQWQQYQLAQLPNPTEAAVTYLQQQVQQLEQQLAYGYQAFEEHSKSTVKYASECAEWKAKAEAAEAQLAAKKEESKNEKALENGEEGQSELALLKSEQEDLLVLLADQHNKITQYRNRLRELKQVVTDDEDD